jgi:hypothetical protein
LQQAIHVFPPRPSVFLLKNGVYKRPIKAAGRLCPSPLLSLSAPPIISIHLHLMPTMAARELSSPPLPNSPSPRPNIRLGGYGAAKPQKKRMTCRSVVIRFDRQVVPCSSCKALSVARRLCKVTTKHVISIPMTMPSYGMLRNRVFSLQPNLVWFFKYPPRCVLMVTRSCFPSWLLLSTYLLRVLGNVGLDAQPCRSSLK